MAINRRKHPQGTRRAQRSQQIRRELSTACLDRIEGYLRFIQKEEEIKAMNGPVKIIMKDGKPV